MFSYDNQKIILVDADGVLLNWEMEFELWMEEQGYQQKQIKDTEEVLYGVEHRYDLDYEHKLRLIKKFNSSTRMLNLPPMRDSIKYVRKLHEEHGYVFELITSMGSNEKYHAWRKKNLINLYGETTFRDFHFLPMAAEKTSILKKFKNKQYYWIEDNIENAIDGLHLGLRSILLAHPHNTNNTLYLDETKEVSYHIPRFQNWKRICYQITGE